MLILFLLSFSLLDPTCDVVGSVFFNGVLAGVGWRIEGRVEVLPAPVGCLDFCSCYFSHESELLSQPTGGQTRAQPSGSALLQQSQISLAKLRRTCSPKPESTINEILTRPLWADSPASSCLDSGLTGLSHQINQKPSKHPIKLEP